VIWQFDNLGLGSGWRGVKNVHEHLKQSREIHRSSTVTSTARPARMRVDIERHDGPRGAGSWWGNKDDSFEITYLISLLFHHRCISTYEWKHIYILATFL